MRLQNEIILKVSILKFPEVLPLIYLKSLFYKQHARIKNGISINNR